MSTPSASVPVGGSHTQQGEEKLSGLAVGPDALVAGGSNGGYQARLHVIPLP